MFDKKTFSEILNKIYKTYTNQRDFADSTGVNRAYLSQYMNEKLESPPSPKVLLKIANNSHKITNYKELMKICGYFEEYTMSAEELLNIDIERDKLKSELENKSLALNLSTNEHDIASSINMFRNRNLDIVEEINSLLANYPELSTTSKQKIKEYILIHEEYQIKDDILFDKKYNSRKDLNSSSNSSYYMCPVYGRISAGQPNWAEECLEGYLPIDPNLMNIIDPEDHFFLRVNGESMNKVIRNGAYALIHKQDTVENGEIAVVLVNGFEATLRKFSKQGDLVILEPMSDDPSFNTQVYNNDTEIKVLGKYVGKFEMNK